MDDLIHHCFREISFDGDLGCNVTRLREFIESYYRHHQSIPAQKVDDVYCAYVWAVIVQQPRVRVGTIAPGASSEVYVAPQVSMKRKAKAKGEEQADNALPATTALEIVPDASIKQLEELRQEHGDGLRVAVDPATTFSAITGSHIRPSKLTPMVYTALQFITRGREEGISVLDLGKKSGYDQKTCFYLIKQLVDLDLVVKRRKPGVSTNICVHKYFFERSEVWQDIVREESRADKAQGQSEDENIDIDDEREGSWSAVQFDPIDARHLSSLPLIRSRITKLLKASPNGLHPASNLLPRLGFSHPVKTDRRFFQVRLRELIEQGVIEKVQVSHPDKKRYPNRKTTCIRLLTSEDTQDTPASDDIVPVDGVDDTEMIGEDETLKMNLTIHKQIISLLDDAGTKGMTLNELSTTLCNFDRRTVELLLSRLEKDPPPAHLGDLGIAQLGETQGRERRYKYFTVRHYHMMVARENFEDPRYSNVDLSQTGGFLQVSEGDFYENEDALVKYVDGFKAGESATEVGGSKGKQAVRKNPILPDGTVKKGRPRKAPASAGPTRVGTSRGKKRKRDTNNDADVPEPADQATEPPAKRKRVQPHKQRDKPIADTSTTTLGEPSGSSVANDITIQGNAQPGKRGRAAKNRSPRNDSDIVPGSERAEAVDADSTEVPAPKKRGRPRKKVDATSAGAGGEGLINANAQAAVPKRRGRPGKTPQSSINEQQVARSFTEIAEEVSRVEHGQAPFEYPTDIIQAVAPDASLIQSPLVSPLFPESAPVTQHELAPVGPPSNSLPEITSGVPTGQWPTSVTNSIIIAGTDTEAATSMSRLVSNGDIPIDPSLLSDGIDAVLHSGDAHTSHHIGAPSLDSSKRPKQDFYPPDPPAKRIKLHDADTGATSGYWAKAKLTQSRREREILQVVDSAGGIVNVSSKDFYEAHAALVESITKEGGTASTIPGSRIDKRTLETTLRDLGAHKKIKILTTTVPTSAIGQRQIRIVSLPEVSEDDLSTFLNNLSITPFPPGTHIKTLDESVTYALPKRTRQHHLQNPQPQSEPASIQKKGPDRHQQLSNLDDDAMRDLLMAEKNTVLQSYGYIVGKAARARRLHLWTIQHLKSDATSYDIVSRRDRIIAFPLYLKDLPISLYCALVPPLHQNDGLLHFLQSPKDRMVPVRDTTSRMRDLLELSRSRPRQRLLELLELLCHLRLAEPLQESLIGRPAITCTDTEGHPSTFDPAPVSDLASRATHVYWRFSTIAPLYLWALSHEAPPFFKNVPVQSVQECEEFWRDIERISIDKQHAKGILSALSNPPTYTPNSELRKIMRRPSSWTAAYSLSWAQCEYLNRLVDFSRGITPLEDEDGGNARLMHASWITGAPQDAISQYFRNIRDKFLRGHEKPRKEEERRIEARRVKEIETKALLVKKAEESRMQREQGWVDMVHKVHPEPLKGSAAERVRRVRARYMQSSGGHSDRWGAEIAEAIQDATIAAKRILSSNRVPFGRPLTNFVPLPPVVASTTEKSIEDLIVQQGPSMTPRAKAKKSKKGKEPEEEATRRHRFQWNRDFDELARDASAIVRARCRNIGRTDLGALEQVFPSIPRNSVRQRVTHLREIPGVETYLQRLEDRWYELWIQHRGTPNLPDEDPESPTNFDLIAHVKFLRNHVDKNALRVGFSEVDRNMRASLPSTLEQLGCLWDVEEKPVASPMWDFVWTGVAEEGREKQLTQQAFIVNASEMPSVSEHASEGLYVAESALKIAMGSPNENYDPQAASRLLESVGEELVQNATLDLLARGILSKVVRDPQRFKPGRILKISENNQNALGGLLPQELFQDAKSLEELLYQEDPTAWRDWSMLSSEGDVAALLELVSEDKIDFKIDISHVQKARMDVDWNSKKADDDDIETSLLLRINNVQGGPSHLPATEDIQEEPVVLPSIAEAASDLVHGSTKDGSTAFCQKSSVGAINCSACLLEASSSLLVDFDQETVGLERKLEEALDKAGQTGLTKHELLTTVDHPRLESVVAVVAEMTNTTPPLAYWTGYTTIVLVSASHIEPWAISVSEKEATTELLLPRRWLDISGRTITDVWEAAQRAVVGAMLLRPGVSQSELRWRLRTAYDRQEINDVLQHLLDEGHAVRRIANSNGTLPYFGPPDDIEEQRIFWFLGDAKHWYQL